MATVPRGVRFLKQLTTDPVRGVLVLVAGRGLQMLAMLATIRLATELMSPTDMGTVNQLTAIAILLASTFVAPVTTYFGRGLLSWSDAGELRGKLNQLLLFVLISALVLGLAAFVVELVADMVPLASAWWVLALVLVYLVAYSVHVVVSTAFAVQGKRALHASLQTVAAWGGLALAVLLFGVFAKPELWLLGIYGGFALSAGGLVLLMWRTGNVAAPSGTPRHAFAFAPREVFAFAWPQAAVYSLWWMQSQSYRFILDDIAGLASVGLFFAAYALCSMPMQMFETLFNEYYAPTLYGKLKDGVQSRWTSAWNEYASAYVPAVILFGMFLVATGPSLAAFLLGEEFRLAGYFVFWPALAETARAVSSSLHTMGIIKVDMRMNIPPVIAGALLAPLLVYFFAPHEPLAGTGMALFFAGMTVLLLVVVISRRALAIQWPLRRIGVAVLTGLPLVIGAQVIYQLVPAIEVGAAAVLLAAAGAYLIVTQYLLARSWIHRASSVPRTHVI